jgi:hypothetical protein
VESEFELNLENANSIPDAMRRMIQYASDATEALEAKIDHGDLDGTTEAVELREALERVQKLSLEISEELDAEVALNWATGSGCWRWT